MGTDRTGTRLSAALRGPVRTCIGCRQTDSWSALLRVAAGSGRDGQPVVVPDPFRRVPGRGAWLHPTLDCYELAVRRRAFGRALRVGAGIDPEPVAIHLAGLGAGGDAARLSSTPTAVHQCSDQPSTGSGFDADEHPMSTQQ